MTCPICHDAATPETANEHGTGTCNVRKKCPLCTRSLPRSRAFFYRRGVTGLSSWCKRCSRGYARRAFAEARAA